MQKLYGISRRLYDLNGDEIIFAKGSGAYVYDTNQKKYIDMILGYGPMILGHNNIKFTNMITEIMNQGFLFPSYNKIQMELAEHINEYYENHQLISIYQSGSDALDAALRICKHITNKNRYIRFGYIGWHDNLLYGGINWHEPINSSKFSKLANDLTEDKKIALNWIGDGVNSFEALCRNNDIACFIFDAYQLERWPNLKIEEVIEICRKNNILVVLDETKTAGRVSKFGYYKDKYKFDFTILGKAIGNGYPVSLLVGSRSFLDTPFDTFKIAGTYARDGLSCGAVLATQQIMDEEHSYDVIGEVGKKIAKIMNNSINCILNSNDIYVKPMLGGAILEFNYSDEFANDYNKRKELASCLLHNGIILPDGHCFYICFEHAHCINEIESCFCSALLDFSKRNY